MSAYALERIATALQLRAKFLDLGCCSIKGDLPAAILDLTELETLILSDEDWDESSNTSVPSQNQLQSNLVSAMPMGLHKLHALKRLIAQDQPIDWSRSEDDLPLQLEDLNVNGCNMTSISWLRNATRLRRLNIGFCPIDSLSGLEKLQALEQLLAYHTEINSLLLFKAGFPQLIEVSLSSSPVTCLEGIEGLSAVTTLDLSWTNITEIEALGACTTLEYLSIADTQVTDLSPIANLQNLIHLDISDCPVMDISPLLCLTKLRRINISNTLVTDVTELQSKGFHVANDRMSLDYQSKNVIVTGCLLKS
jgi:Leucine-rich repeat (LRR) protein